MHYCLANPQLKKENSEKFFFAVKRILGKFERMKRKGEGQIASAFWCRN